MTDTCGGRIEAVNGTLTSPSFPELYPGNKTCTWEIIAPPQYKITFNFTHFDLEGNNVSTGVLFADENNVVQHLTGVHFLQFHQVRTTNLLFASVLTIAVLRRCARAGRFSLLFTMYTDIFDRPDANTIASKCTVRLARMAFVSTAFIAAVDYHRSSRPRLTS